MYPYFSSLCRRTTTKRFSITTKPPSLPPLPLCCPSLAWDRCTCIEETRRMRHNALKRCWRPTPTTTKQWKFWAPSMQHRMIRKKETLPKYVYITDYFVTPAIIRLLLWNELKSYAEWSVFGDTALTASTNIHHILNKTSSTCEQPFLISLIRNRSYLDQFIFKLRCRVFMTLDALLRHVRRLITWNIPTGVFTAFFSSCWQFATHTLVYNLVPHCSTFHFTVLSSASVVWILK